MKTSIRTSLIGTAMAVSMTTAANAGDLGIGVVGGTQGLGAYVGYKLNDTVSFRLQGSKWNFTENRTVDNIDYNLDVDVGAVGAYVDLFPFQGTFRISAGLTRSLIDATASNASTEVTQIGDAKITINPGEVSGNIQFDTAPYLGIGWGRTAPKGWGFRFDLGAHFLGKPDVTLKVTGNARTQLDAAATAIGSTADAEIAKEERKARDDIGDVIYPEVSIAVSYGW